MPKVQILLPPLKGLNLYDNPLVMEALYAPKLINFMPPTSVLKVRPGIVQVWQADGQIRGLYSYMTGQTTSYAAHWYDTTIQYGSANYLILKILNADLTSSLVRIDINNTSDVATLGDMPTGVTYNDDTCMFNHTMFIATGGLSDPMKLYNKMKGLANFTFTMGDSSETCINNLENLCFFNGYIYANGFGSLDIFYQDAKYADCLDPMNQSFWNSVANWFSPSYGAKFSLEGIVAHSTTILKMVMIGRSGSDTLSGYLCVITKEGEIILLEGEHAGDPSWKVAGRFIIPPPLNKWCFADMEGDLIIATQNGLVSLRRLAFGQSSEVTENLEYKTSSLFSQYMFEMPVFKDYFSLYYHPRNRLLMFNCPTEIPMPFKDIVVGFTFEKDTYLEFPSEENAFQGEALTNLKTFVLKVILQNTIDYTYAVRLNGFVGGKDITYDFQTVVNGKASITYFYIKVNTNMGMTDCIGYQSPTEGPQSWTPGVTFHCADFANATDISQITMMDPIAYPAYNPSLKIYQNGQNVVAYRFDTDYEVTSMSPIVGSFYHKTTIYTPYNCSPTQTTNFSSLTANDMRLTKNFYGLVTPVQDCADFFQTYMPASSGYYSEGGQPMPPVKCVSALNLWSYNFAIWNMAWLFALGGGGSSDGNFDLGSTPMTYSAFATLNYTLPDGSQGSKQLSFNMKWQGVRAGHETTNNAPFFNIDYCEIFIELDGVPIISGTGGKIGADDASRFCGAKAFEVGPIDWQVNYNADMPTVAAGLPKAMFPTTPVSVSWSPSFQAEWEGIPGGQDRFRDACYEYFPNNYTPTGVNWQTDSFGWMMSSVLFATKTTLPQDAKPARNFFRRKKEEAPRATKSFSDIPPDDPTITDYDISTLPVLKSCNILTNFKSTQYVFDSHFGTWSQWEDVNMIKGIEHNNEFYFVVPNNVTQAPDGTGAYYTSFKLCKFDNAALGDFPNEELSQFTPIHCAYSTTSVMFEEANFKSFLRLRVFGNPNAFYQQQDPAHPMPYPFTIQPFSDFKSGQIMNYVHGFDGDGTFRKVLSKHFGGKKLHELTRSERKSFRKLYEDASQQIVFIDLPLRATYGKRFSLDLELDIIEAFVNIFGYEIIYEPLAKV